MGFLMQLSYKMHFKYYRVFLPGLYPAFFLQFYFQVVIPSVVIQNIDEFQESINEVYN